MNKNEGNKIKDLRNIAEEVKKKHPDTLVMFRSNNSYLLIGEDAKIASDILRITLSHDSIDKELTAAFPSYAIDMYLPRLFRAGKRVAFCNNVQERQTTLKR